MRTLTHYDTSANYALYRKVPLEIKGHFRPLLGLSRKEEHHKSRLMHTRRIITWRRLRNTLNTLGDTYLGQDKKCCSIFEPQATFFPFDHCLFGRYTRLLQRRSSLPVITREQAPLSAIRRTRLSGGEGANVHAGRTGRRRISVSHQLEDFSP